MILNLMIKERKSISLKQGSQDILKDSAFQYYRFKEFNKETIVKGCNDVKREEEYFISENPLFRLVNTVQRVTDC